MKFHASEFSFDVVEKFYSKSLLLQGLNLYSVRVRNINFSIRGIFPVRASYNLSIARANLRGGWGGGGNDENADRR